MPSTYKTPGVYIEEISKFPPSVAQVETAIPAFIGYTHTAVGDRGESLVMHPTRITSLLEYETYFGTAPPEEGVTVTVTEETNDEGARTAVSATAALDEDAPSPFKMYYAMQLYFANGGGPCYVVSVATLEVPDGGGGGDGDGGPPAPPTEPALGDPDEGLLGGLAEVEKEDEPTLIVFPDATALSATDYHSLQVESLAQCAKLQDRFAVIDVLQDETDPIDTFRDGIGTSNLKYGAAYHPYLVTNIRFETDPASVTLAGDASGTLDSVQESDTEVYSAAQRAINALEMTLPPSSGVVGVYAEVDRTRGVWKAPANVSLARVIRPSITITAEAQEGLNVATSGKSINAIRSFTGKGTLIWGARTLAGNDNEWRYVPVRRFFNMVEESVKKATEAFVFEPNDANTWVKVRAMIENFLLLQWRAGALAGAKPEQAFFVKVGLGETMTALDVLEGRMIVEIGMAAVRPAEFIILKFSHKMQEA
jgi:phage tail sheath protein FI